jgi:YesN/AraC family two-component response regulator
MGNRIRLTDRYAVDKGAVEELYLLDCVRKGLRGNIEAVFSSGKYLDQMEKLFGNDLSFARMVFSFIWSKIVYVAVEGGLPASTSGEYAKYYDKLQNAKSVSTLLEMNKQIFIEFADKVALASADARLSPIVWKIHRFISDHIYEKLSVGYIAQKLRYSRSHLSHVYKNETKETIRSRIQHSKIIEAKRLLQYSSFSLNDIRHKLGFCSQSHFTGVFRKETGMTPHQYRDIYQENRVVTIQSPAGDSEHRRNEGALALNEPIGSERG